MGGFTQVFLKETNQANIDKHNAKLEVYGVPKKYRFYSEFDVRLEYEFFKVGEGEFPEDLFPRDEIKSFVDFKRYWSPSALGEVFVPHFGTLQFDCYFGRTSKRAMRAIGKYIADNHSDIDRVSGSFSTFMERGMTKLEREIINESGIKNI